MWTSGTGAQTRNFLAGSLMLYILSNMGNIVKMLIIRPPFGLKKTGQNTETVSVIRLNTE